MSGRAFAQNAPTKIGIIGAGNIGGTVGELWVKAGHSVFFSSRNPSNIKPLIEKLGPRAQAGTVAQALDFSDVILVAVPYKALPELGKKFEHKFSGKTVIDPNNAIWYRDGAGLLNETRKQGIGETTAAYLKGATVVRAFNSMNYDRFAALAHRKGSRVALPIAGDDPRALKIVTALVNDAGFDVVAVPMSRAKEFVIGGPLFGAEITASELRKRLGLAK
jgi:predicted dinucleotide-binding enzyme